MSGYTSQDIGRAVAKIFDSRDARDQGRYCECAEPEVYDRAQICQLCGLHNKDQERKAVAWIADAHDFVEGGMLGGLLCARCTYAADSPRHNGIAITPSYTWDQPEHASDEDGRTA